MGLFVQLVMVFHAECFPILHYRLYSIYSWDAVLIIENYVLWRWEEMRALSALSHPRSLFLSAVNRRELWMNHMGPEEICISLQS
jgi:hypothetical protein